MDNIAERFLYKNRWFVRLKEPLNGLRTMPLANYVWLKGNPSFKEIPKGYAIHHLDLDQLNDNIDNLALMQKHYHTAYHLNHIVLTPVIYIKNNYIDDNHVFYPLSRPYIKLKRDTGRYQVRIREDVGGEIKFSYVSKYKGKRFNTKEEAEAYVEIIWPQK